MEAVIIEKEALQLSDYERAVLADRLLASLSRRPAGLDDAWLREADERMAAYRESKVETVPVLNDLLDSIGRGDRGDCRVS